MGILDSLAEINQSIENKVREINDNIGNTITGWVGSYEEKLKRGFNLISPIDISDNYQITKNFNLEDIIPTREDWEYGIDKTAELIRTPFRVIDEALTGKETKPEGGIADDLKNILDKAGDVLKEAVKAGKKPIGEAFFSKELLFIIALAIIFLILISNAERKVFK